MEYAAVYIRGNSAHTCINYLMTRFVNNSRFFHMKVQLLLYQILLKRYNNILIVPLFLQILSSAVSYFTLLRNHAGDA